MIIAKAPLRISIGGGGTDLPSFYQEHGSMFISAAIDKYIYITIHKNFKPGLIIKYSEYEKSETVQDIRHPIFRESLKMFNGVEQIEIGSFADIPAGTGLGSSGAFTVALLKALYTYTDKLHSNMQIAEEACDIEINKLASPIGKQDQYISAMGGVTRFQIDRQGTVSAEPLKVSPATMIDLEEHLLLFFTGYSRSANVILKEQDDKTKSDKVADKNEILTNLKFTQQLGFEIGSAIENDNLNEFARLMNVHWEYKKQRSKNMSSNQIDEWYALAMRNGALGGKLIGAGGGGFLMFLADDKRRLRKSMREAGLNEVPFRFDKLGAQVVLRE